jgi:hypothetical protein
MGLRDNPAFRAHMRTSVGWSEMSRASVKQDRQPRRVWTRQIDPGSRAELLSVMEAGS